MKAVEVGERVGCISHSDGTTRTVFIFGFGKYVGRRIPHGAGGSWGKSLVEATNVVLNEAKEKMSEEDFKKVEERVVELYGNPCLELDNGQLVFGCECWWASEAQVKEQIGRFDKVVTIELEAARRGEHVVVPS